LWAETYRGENDAIDAQLDDRLSWPRWDQHVVAYSRDLLKIEMGSRPILDDDLQLTGICPLRGLFTSTHDGKGSPDGAQRNPGFSSSTSLPGLRCAHPG